MNKLTEILASRKLPALGFGEGVDPEKRRLELVDILSEHIYGYTPDFKSEVTAEVILDRKDVYGERGRSIGFNITVTTPKGKFTFPLWLCYPKTDKKIPLMVYIHFDLRQPSGHTPDEEIFDRGVALAKIYYNDIMPDVRGDVSSAIAGHFPREEYGASAWGQVGMWAWAASRALDHLLTLDVFDTERIAIVGHSRLGKTALWCGAQDTRFTHVIANNSGCSGDAITRGKRGETIKDITVTSWFCDKYRDYIGDGLANMPFDQHFLLAAVAPRKLCIGAADLDIWADPESEYLACVAASEAWECRGLDGFVHPDRMPKIGEVMYSGDVGFHLRSGDHQLCRHDFMKYIDFLLA